MHVFIFANKQLAIITKCYYSPPILFQKGWCGPLKFILSFMVYICFIKINLKITLRTFFLLHISLWKYVYSFLHYILLYISKFCHTYATLSFTKAVTSFWKDATHMEHEKKTKKHHLKRFCISYSLTKTKQKNQ